MTHTVAHEVWGYENVSHDERDVYAILRAAEEHADDANTKGTNILNDLAQLGSRVTALDGKVDGVVSDLAASAQREQQMIDLLDAHSSGTIDAAAVVEGIRQLIHQATEPDGGGGDPL